MVDIQVKYYPEDPQGLPIDPRGYIRPGYKKTRINWIAIHEAGNSNANAGAANHLKYLKSLTVSNPNKTYISFGYFVQGRRVDNTEGALIYNIVPDDEQSWCTTDGKNPNGGNRTGISIEIADSTSYDFYDGVDQAAQLVAHLMHKHGLDINAVKRHLDFYAPSGCPARISREGLWDKFKTDVMNYYNSNPVQPNPSPQPPTPTPPTPPTTELKVGDIVTVNGTIYSDAWKKPPTGQINGEQLAITRIQTRYSPTSPYHVGGKGWTTLDAITAGGTTPPTPPTTNNYKVGDKVYLSGSSRIYGSAWGLCGSISINASAVYTILAIHSGNYQTKPYQVRGGFVDINAIVRKV